MLGATVSNDNTFKLAKVTYGTVIHDISIIRSLYDQNCFIPNYAQCPLHISYLYNIQI